MYQPTRITLIVADDADLIRETRITRIVADYADLIREIGVNPRDPRLAHVDRDRVAMRSNVSWAGPAATLD